MQTKGFIIKRVWVIAISLAIVLVSCKNGVSEFIPAFDDEPIVSPLATELGFSKDRPLVMGMNTSYAPLQYVNSQGLPTGYDVEFTKKLLMRMGIPYTFSPNHWDKMSPGIIGGKYDMGMLVYSSYRKDTTNYSDAVFRMYYQVVYRKKDFAEFDFRHLKGKRIAYMKSRPIGLMLKDEEADGYPITDLNEAIVDLANGKYDGVICYRFQAKYNVGLLHLSDQLKYASPHNIDKFVEEIKLVFGDIKIPMWVWWLLTGLVFLFMVVYVVNKNRYNRRLQSANAQLQKNNKALQLATARAEESTRMKSIFIEQISHEIRTPLNIICGFTQVLTTTDAELDKAEKRDMSVQIIDNAERITGLVNKMLALAEINSSVVLEREDHTSAAVIAQEAIKAAGINKASHVQFNLVKLFGAEQMFETHLRSAVLALQQLLDNAKKFTEQGQVTLQISNHEGQAYFVVEDTGTSIPVYQAERIFDEFVQLDEYSDGTGIGLSIARSLARRLGGDIVLDTTYTGGARFVMTLQSQQEETA